MSAAETIYTQCANCGVTFGQPNDPGKKQKYHSNACRQQAYRNRGGRATGTRNETPNARQRRAEQEAWAADQARRERERERAQERRRAHSGRGQERIPTPEWTHPRYSDDAKSAKWRNVCHLLMKRAEVDTANAFEAEQCRIKAAKLRERYGL